MTGSTRIKGNKLALSFGGVEYWADITSYELDNEEASSDVTTYADAAEGGARQFFLNLSAIQSTMVGSFWDYAWENTGNVVAYRLAPHGNETATPDEPHFIGTVKIGPKPKLGGEASTTADHTFETRWNCQEEPTKDVGTDGEPIILSITPEGQEAGEQIVIIGQRFGGATGVSIDGDPAEFVPVSVSTITAIIPAEAEGEVDVTVTTAAGESDPVAYVVAGGE